MECPICESPQSTSHYLVKGCDIVECRHCSMIYVPTPAPEFASAYNDSIKSKPIESGSFYNYRSEISSHLITFKARLEESEKILAQKGRLLDVGCALGHLGEAAKRRGWDVYVTDVSEYAVLESREQFHLNAFISGPDKLPVLTGKFNLVTLYNVVEHLSHPLDLLKEISRTLANDGLLHVTTPNSCSWSARIMGKHWFHLKPSENFLYFTPETLHSVLERSGFEVVKIKPVSNSMRVSDILLRLERYSKWFSRWINTWVRRLGLGDIRLWVYTGEIQAWARPAHRKPEEKIYPVKDILDIVCCANCKSQIQFFEDNEAICTQCELSFEVVKGVINFSKYAKRTKRKIVGTS